MKALFGSAVNSLSSVQSALDEKLGEKTAILYKNREKGYSTKKVLLFPNVNSLRSGVKKLQDWNGVAIVFDSPTNLYSIPKLQWLDVKRNTDALSYKFQFIEPNYDKVVEAFQSKGEQQVLIHKNSILRSLVILRSETPFLESLHNFLYFCTSHSNREMCKKYLLDYFNNTLTLEKLKTEWKGLLRTDRVDSYFVKFFDYLKSEEGIRLKNAWLGLSPKTDAAKVSKKYEVHLKDIRYLQRAAKLFKENIVRWKNP